VDNSAAAAYVALQAERAGNCRVLPLGAVTKDRLGNELADLGQLARAGAVGFSDAKSPIASAEIMRRALQYARMFDRPILTHPLDPTLSAEGVMHEGAVSTVLGLRGIPAAAEDIIAGRDVALAELTGGHVHLMTVTTRHAVDQVRRAKAVGLHVTCDVTPHHLALTDDSLQTYSSAYKVMPPLRSREHVDALIAGLQEGVIDAISSDHRPWAAEKKDVELDRAPFGIVGVGDAAPHHRGNADCSRSFDVAATAGEVDRRTCSHSAKAAGNSGRGCHRRRHGVRSRSPLDHRTAAVPVEIAQLAICRALGPRPDSLYTGGGRGSLSAKLIGFDSDTASGSWTSIDRDEFPMAVERDFLIDGYNLLHAAGMAQQRYARGDLDRARGRLLAWLVARLTSEERQRCTVGLRRPSRPAASGRAPHLAAG
jgi:hypothetical protein